MTSMIPQSQKSQGPRLGFHLIKRNWWTMVGVCALLRTLLVFLKALLPASTTIITGQFWMRSKEIEALTLSLCRFSSTAQTVKEEINPWHLRVLVCLAPGDMNRELISISLPSLSVLSGQIHSSLHTSHKLEWRMWSSTCGTDPSYPGKHGEEHVFDFSSPFYTIVNGKHDGGSMKCV